MAKQGRAAEALHYAFISSVIGGVLGVLVLIFFTPMLAEFALKFGPSELFWTAVLGVTVIGSLGAQSVVKGLFAGVFGLWLSTIGYDPINGVARFVFTDHLQGGINIIAALIGLFAIPQVFGMFEGAASTERDPFYEMENRSVLDSLRTNLRRVKVLAIGSVVGIFVGLIPGAGGQIAGLVSYDQNRKFSSRRDEFRQGRTRRRHRLGGGQQRHGRSLAGAAVDAQHSRQPDRRGAARRPVDPRPVSGAEPVHPARQSYVDLHRLAACSARF